MMVRIASFAFALVSGVVILAAGSRTNTDYPGEYGLWVEDRRDSLVVHWITSEPVVGVLGVVAGGQQQSFQTAIGRTHAVAVRRPRGAEVTLTYGASGKVFSTTIGLQPGKRMAVAPAVDSIYVIGDTHGEFDKTVQLFKAA